MYKVVIFDLDGTLLNTIDDLANACNYALDTLSFPTHEVEEYKAFVGDGRYKLIERILPEKYRETEIINKVLALFDEYYEVHMLDMTKPYDGIIELLDNLIEMNLRLAVVSNKPHEFTIKVVKNFFNDRFKVIFGHRPNVPTKPDPATVFDVMKSFDVKPEECIYIGDSNVDIKTARNAGVKSIGVTWGFRSREELQAEGADTIVSNVSELKKIIIS